MDTNDKTFRPTTQWMTEKYAEMNTLLFKGELGECNFNIFTSGKGSEGGVLGWFKILGRNIKAKRSNRRLFKQYGWDEIYVDRKNFVKLCIPTIELNGNYNGTEHGFLATLVHEMCHYYTYMYGYVPKQGHGREFKEIGQIVSARSNGLFTIQRLATAEQMSELELNDAMKAKREKRLTNKKASVTAIIVYTQENKIKLTITSNIDLINKITREEERRGEKVITTNNADVIEFLFSKGYKKNMRTWRYWSLEDKPWINELNNLLPNNTETQPKKQETTLNVHNHRPKRLFSIKTSNGMFECDGSNYYTLLNTLKQRFPNMNDETINKIINNPNNYRMQENKNKMTNIIQEVINEFIKTNTDKNDTIDITPNMNLGEYSPLEL